MNQFIYNIKYLTFIKKDLFYKSMINLTIRQTFNKGVDYVSQNGFNSDSHIKLLINNRFKMVVQMPKSQLINFSIRASYLDKNKNLKYIELYSKSIYIQNNLNSYLKDINNKVDSKLVKWNINLNNIQTVIIHAEVESKMKK